jgi:succinyl-diaminopimelate desuccinylase
MDSSSPLALALALMREPSVTPDAAGCFDLLESWLIDLGFRVLRKTFEGDGGAPTENFYARRGANSPHLCFAGHVDVVPPGDAAAWRVPPFAPEIRDGMLYGRGAEDMKGAVAAMVSAAARFFARRPHPRGSLSFLLTADEEGNAINGTKKMLELLEERGEIPEFCLVGEPTNPSFIGEMAKIGRRGSLSATLRVRGKQGHVAYPHLAENPITRLIEMLHRIKTAALDEGTEFFGPSNLEITSIDTGNISGNSIPAETRAEFNIRFNDTHTGEQLECWIRAQCETVGGAFDLTTRISGEPFFSPPGALSDALVAAVREVTGHVPRLSTTGGTSDARFIRQYCPVIEFGATGFTPHQVDERVSVEALEQLVRVYEALLEKMLT